MKFWRGRIPWCVVASAVALACAQPSPAQAPARPRGRPIEFSQPRGSDGTNHLQEASETARGFEMELFPRSDITAPQSSMDGMVAPPTRRPIGSVMPGKKVQELLERKKNWAFMNPDEFSTDKTKDPDDPTRADYDLDGTQKKKSSAIESFFEERQHKTKAKKGDRSKPDGRDDQMDQRFLSELNDSPLNSKSDRHDLRPERDSDSLLPPNLRETQDSLRKLVDPDSNERLGGSESRSVGGDLFNLDRGTPLVATSSAAEKDRMARFRQMINLPATPTLGVDPVSGGVDTGNPTDTKSVAGANLSSLPSSSLPHDSMSGVNPSFGRLAPLPGGFADSSFKSPFAGATPAFPQVDTQPKLSPPPPTFLAPKRPF